ncbi:putative pyrroloquinoline-quinone binding quinoprotein [Stackebrandtia endophytica]|uniref:Putative pyrroloquinoline-quinone binding quinoprotein n=1 Tax=Stackebrandtia endophytica TaxID=1496996 RepID=A0A543AWY6_9ACTN|nr:hsp70 family protein [Stackebrandtia endophytica]TQL77082.1 putative pyrroloquinoline-quinone binding quinoprotein [Stackebrandtia endophytica]
MSSPNGYALGIDLGTSHTVAVVRSPDGRSRPLLVDGAPVMPSSVFLDETGAIHVGRDAQRLAQTDPARFEPNPKHRIGDSSVLLGDRDVPTVDLLAAILRNVATKAVEAVGHLPPTVLTFPAKWGPQRRGVLEQAAAKAGYPAPRMVPEPVAAAHYFVEVMRQPIPQGESVAVFDFGGGTLDIAVVRHEHGGGFTVLSDGGLEDLGGLDIDAALVQYLGQTIAAHVPQVWQQLTQPANGTDRRHRRLFWDDVRGAKEMLSRTAVAPVPVPGVESALHMTREELERLAQPLLARAVAETERVITSAGLRPDQLAGLFLVGGASRIPLVARLLHSQLGIAPTVLEQPELPVAEGSLAAAFPPEPEPEVAPVTPPPAAEPYTPPTPPEEPKDDAFLEPAAAPTPWYKRKTTWIGTAAGVVALALLTAWLVYDPYPEREMSPLTQVGTDVTYPGGRADVPYVYQPDVDGDIAYYLTSPESDVAYLTAVDLTTAERVWDSAPFTVEDLNGVVAENGILYIDEWDGEAYRYTFIDPDTGERLNTLSFNTGDWTRIVNGRLVHFQADGRVAGYDATGQRQWQTDLGGAKLQNGAVVHTWDHESKRRNHSFTGTDGYAWTVDEEGLLSVLDVDTGQVTAAKSLAAHDDHYFGYEGTLFVADAETGYSLTAYDLTDGLASLWTFKPEGATREVSLMKACGQTRICVLEDRDEDDTTDGVMVLDFDDGGELAWESPTDMAVTTAWPAGEQLLVVTAGDEENSVNQMYDSRFEPSGSPLTRGLSRIDSGSFLTVPSAWDDPKFASDDRSFVGLGAQTGQRYELGTESIIPQCEATDMYLTCATDTGFRVWSYRT